MTVNHSYQAEAPTTRQFVGPRALFFSERLRCMARIRRIEKGVQSVSVHPTEVDCFYQVVIGDDGRRYLHLTTFGSDGRKSKAKSSQSIQLSKAVADELVEVIERTFG